MDDARKAQGEAKAVEPSDFEKVTAYQYATDAVMKAASAGHSSVNIAFENFALLRYVGTKLTEQGLKVSFDFDSVKLAAKWG